MKVKCINTEGWIKRKSKKNWTGPKENAIVTVIGEHWSEGKLFYRLLEWPQPDDGGFISIMFIPIEEKYETVSFKEIKEKASVN